MQASFIAKRSLASLRLQHGFFTTRCLHNTPAVYKKKSTVGIDDLFFDESSGNLFEDEVSTSMSTKQSSAPSASVPASLTSDITSTPKKKRLTYEERQTRYDELLAFVKPRLGRNPEVKPVKPHIRNSAWLQLVSLAETERQLQEIAELFPAWKDSGRELNATFSELFVRRCEELSCPKVAINVFGDYAKYNLKLTLPAARQLLHSVHLTEPREAYGMALLYSMYNLPEISKDLVSFSMLLTALFKENSKESTRLAKRFVPNLKQLVVGSGKNQQQQEEPVGTTSGQKEKWNTWLKWSLKKVDKALFVQNGLREEWLRDWRMRSGHILEPTRF
ncbi:hypothetical protein M378DRAFT_162921 [Amanita muscaria Koide BX008]|uniref:Uncharacterized protein n=1 Tax=Amanita muscaria (strain Koide BX008) TaxID=946122 RepID=A0A0C2WST2_AMAMK|nr:hypothetical protein M378DRAFT_162921 [Amanita muscaria Koide BX008]